MFRNGRSYDVFTQGMIINGLNSRKNEKYIKIIEIYLILCFSILRGHHEILFFSSETLQNILF